MLSHVNLVSNARSVVQYLGLVPQDRMMVVLPFYYIFGRSLLYTHFLSGGSLVIDNRFAYPAAILNTMQEQEVTCLAGVPSTYSILLNKSDLRARKFPHLRFVDPGRGRHAEGHATGGSRGLSPGSPLRHVRSDGSGPAPDVCRAGDASRASGVPSAGPFLAWRLW